MFESLKSEFMTMGSLPCEVVPFSWTGLRLS